MGYSHERPYSEKRESPRINWTDSEVQVSVISSHTKSKVLGWIRDLSQGGFKLEAVIHLALNDLLQERDEIYFETFEDFFQLKGEGRVIWTSPHENAETRQHSTENNFPFVCFHERGHPLVPRRRARCRNHAGNRIA